MRDRLAALKRSLPRRTSVSGTTPLDLGTREYLSYATTAYDALEHYFATDHDLYRETWPQRRGEHYAYHWPFAQAMAAAIDLRGLSTIYQPAVQRCLAGAARYWTGRGYASAVVPPLGPGGDHFYDDNLWSGLNLMRVFRIEGEQPVLDMARQVFDFVVSGWDANPTHPAPGGIFWKEQTTTETNHDRNTVSNAPAAELGLRLYQITGRTEDYDWSWRMYEWTNRHLLAPNGLYWDHLDQRGAIERTQWSYNQGTMIGANVLLYRIWRDRQPETAARYLTEAERIARAALAYYDHAGYFRQDPAFNAIFFRNLLLLASVTNDAALPDAIRLAIAGYAERVWDDQRIHQRTDLFAFQGRTITLLDQAAMVQIYACLAWPPDRYDALV